MVQLHQNKRIENFEFRSLLQAMLFLKSPKLLTSLDKAFKVRSFSTKLTPSENQECLVETAFSLLKPREMQVHISDVTTFFMVLLGVEAPETKFRDTRDCFRELIFNRQNNEKQMSQT